MRLSSVIRKVRDACPAECSCCEEACAKRLGSLGPVIKAENVHKVHTFKAITCFQCSEPLCMEACSAGAIVKGEEDGVVQVIREECIGCEACVPACPYENMFFDSEMQVAFKCQMCDGDPECVKACPFGALELFRGHSIQSYMSDEDFLVLGTRACAGCPAELALRFTLRVVGDKDTVVFGCPGCMTTLMIGSGTMASIRLPYVNCLFTNVPSTMTGVYEYYRHIGKKANLVAFVGDGCVSDVSFQMLSGAAERGERIIVICYDNEGYMNTGIQRSSTTPFGAWTNTSPIGKVQHGKAQNSKYMPLIMVFHNIPYVATASPAYLEDYAQKLTKALNVKDGMSYIHLLTPCPIGWRFPIDRGIEVAQSAVETNYFPLWECEQGKLHITEEIKAPKPIGEFTKMMGRFSHLNTGEVQQLQRLVDERFARIKALALLTKDAEKGEPHE